jgi:hypothetical protein
LLLLPAVAMQLSEEMNWTAFDFIFLALMLGGTGLGLELAARRRSRAFLLGTGLMLAGCFFLIMVTGAVGIIGSERDAANLLFLGVVLIALLGGLAARFRPAGMARVMFLTAAAQALVPLVAALAWPEMRGSIWQPEVPVTTVAMVGLWLVAAMLFRKSAA